MPNRAINDRNQPFVISLGVGDFFPARARGARVRADDEYKIIDFFDVGADLFPPLRGWRNVLKVDPYLPLVPTQAVP